MIKMPSKMPVYLFIEQILKSKSLFEMFDILVKEMTPINSSEESLTIIKYKFYYPILRFIRKVIETEFGFMIDVESIKMLILNPYEDLFLTSVEDIVKYQSQQVKIGVKNYVDQSCETL